MTTVYHPVFYFINYNEVISDIQCIDGKEQAYQTSQTMAQDDIMRKR